MAAMKRAAVGGHPEWTGTVSVQSLARRWNATPKKVRRLIARERIAFTQIGGRVRVAWDDVERFERLCGGRSAVGLRLEPRAEAAV